MKDNNKIFLDVRTPGEFVETHIPNSYLIPLDELMDRKDEVLRMKGKIIIVCRSGARAHVAYDFLKSIGVENMEVMEGGIIEYDFSDGELESGNIQTINN